MLSQTVPKRPSASWSSGQKTKSTFPDRESGWRLWPSTCDCPSHRQSEQQSQPNLWLLQHPSVSRWPDPTLPRYPADRYQRLSIRRGDKAIVTAGRQAKPTKSRRCVERALCESATGSPPCSSRSKPVRHAGRLESDLSKSSQRCWPLDAQSNQHHQASLLWIRNRQRSYAKFSNRHLAPLPKDVIHLR